MKEYILTSVQVTPPCAVVSFTQGVVIHVCAILTAAIGLGDPYIAEMGVAHRVAPYITK